MMRVIIRLMLLCVLAVPVLAGANDYRTREAIVRQGDTLYIILTKAGVVRSEALKVISEIEKVYEPKSLEIGQTIRLGFQPNRRNLDYVHIMLSDADWVQVRYDKGGKFYAVKMQNNELVRGEPGTASHKKKLPAGGKGLKLVKTKTERSLYKTMQKNRIPRNIQKRLTKEFGSRLDLQRDIKKGQKLTILYQQGKPSKLVYAALNTGKETMALYRFPDMHSDKFYNEKGESTSFALLPTTVDGARISSHFGRRKHPVLGYTRMHQGIDFAVPEGTPVYAAGDGIIDEVGEKGSYGNYVRIRHRGNYQTAYAHLKGFRDGLETETRVKQGDIIAYVGSTGLATGPHLHYEVIKNGKKINPALIKNGTIEKLKYDELADFYRLVAKTDKLTRSSRYYAFTKNRPPKPKPVAVVPTQPQQLAPPKPTRQISSKSSKDSGDSPRMREAKQRLENLNQIKARQAVMQQAARAQLQQQQLQQNASPHPMLSPR